MEPTILYFLYTENAFDRDEWNFLKQILHHMGFGINFKGVGRCTLYRTIDYDIFNKIVSQQI